MENQANIEKYIKSLPEHKQKAIEKLKTNNNLSLLEAIYKDIENSIVKAFRK